MQFRAYHEDSGRDRNTLERLLKQALIETDKLRYEGHVGVSDRTSIFQVGETLVEGHFLFVN